MTTRPPAVAGQFYPHDPAALTRLVEECLRNVPREARRAPAAIVPHAGLVFSGHGAGAVFGRLALPRTVVILAPNHTGRCDSPGASLWRSGAFATPLGDVRVDEEFAGALEQACDLVAHDPSAHRSEHAIEVQLPFLQVMSPASAIVPIVIAGEDWARSERLAAALASLAGKAPATVTIIATSDMTHYEPARSAERKDRPALQAIERLDGHALLDICREQQLTMCGRAPAAIAIEAARRLGASHADLVDYRHSGLVTGDDSDVVSYAGVIVQ